MKKKEILVLITILFAGYGIFADAVIVPLLTLIFNEFPNSNTFLENFIISGPALIAIPAALISGKLAQYYTKKSILIVGFILYLIGGLGGAFVNSAEFLAITRAFSGAAQGTIGTIALSLIIEIYTDFKERGNVMGWYNATSAIFGTVMSIFAGVIALNGWRYAFFINGFGLFSLIMIILFLPKTPPEGKQQEKYINNTNYTNEKYPYKSIIAILISLLFMSTLYCVIYYMIDLYVSEKALGTSALSGTLSSIGTVASLLMSMLFGIVYIKIKRFSSTLFFLATSISFIALSVTTNVIIVLIACAVSGASYALSLAHYSMSIAEIVPESKISLSMSFYNALINISIFLSPYVPLVIQTIFEVETISGSFTYIGVLLAICGSLSLILSLKDKQQNIHMYNK